GGGTQLSHRGTLIRLVNGVPLAGQVLGLGRDPLKSVATGKTGGPDGGLKPNLPKQLGGARGEAAGARVNQEVGVAFDQQRSHAMPGQEERGGETGQATTDDQDRCRLVAVTDR